MRILVLPGDGIGAEITDAALAVLRAANGRHQLGLELEFGDIGFAALEKTGTTLPEDVLERARQSHGVILGPISHLDYPPRDEGGVRFAEDVVARLPSRLQRRVEIRGPPRRSIQSRMRVRFASATPRKSPTPL